MVPVWNEVADIAACIDRIAAQDFPVSDLEVVIADGGSTDGTAHRAREAAAPHGFRRFAVVDNPRRRTSYGLNAALQEVTSDYVVRIDARSRVEPHYVRTCVDVLRTRPDVGVVGGSQRAVARSSAPMDVAIARALRNPWTTGGSRYRRAAASGPSDTVWMGSFRTGDLRALGGWNEDVALNEDYELNERYRRRGWIVWFETSLRSTYLPRATVGRVARQYFYFGRVKGLWWVRGASVGKRHRVLLGGAAAAAAAAIVVVRRHGPLPLGAAVIAAGVALEAAGRDPEPAPIQVHGRAAALHLVVVGSWLTGVAVGAAGERLGIRHQHA